MLLRIIRRLRLPALLLLKPIYLPAIQQQPTALRLEMHGPCQAVCLGQRPTSSCSCKAICVNLSPELRRHAHLRL